MYVKRSDVKERKPTGPIDVLMVVPFGTDPAGRASPQVHALAEHTADCIVRYRPRAVIWSGGYAGPDGETEARQMKRLTEKALAIAHQQHCLADVKQYYEIYTKDTNQQIKMLRHKILPQLIIPKSRLKLHLVAEEEHFPRVLRHAERLLGKQVILTGTHAHDARLTWDNSKGILQNRNRFVAREQKTYLLYEMGLADILSFVFSR